MTWRISSLGQTTNSTNRIRRHLSPTPTLCKPQSVSKQFKKSRNPTARVEKVDMLASFRNAEDIPLKLQERSAKFVERNDIHCSKSSPRASSGPSANSLASSASEADMLADLLAFPLDSCHHGKQQLQSADAGYAHQHQQEAYWPEFELINSQGQLPLVPFGEEELDKVMDNLLVNPDPFGTQLMNALQPTVAGSLAQQAMPVPVGQKWTEDCPSTSNDASADTDRMTSKPYINRKRGRGPKPKYVYASTNEALKARKERNRQAALQSYYKKRQRVEELNKEAEVLEAENAALKRLAQLLEVGGATGLEEASQEGIDKYLRTITLKNT